MIREDVHRSNVISNYEMQRDRRETNCVAKSPKT